jgi:Protein of unknown function (DUF3179)
VWKTTVGGRQLHFQLAGINNQNFIMRDAETGSWWQQVTGEAIQGPLKGQRLQGVFHDELTFALWKREHPEGRVLRPNEAIAAAGKYAPADWELRMTARPVTTSFAYDRSIEPRTLVVGVTVKNVSKAYPYDLISKQQLILDELGGVPIFVVIGEDKKSVRAFERTVEGRKLEFFIKPNTSPFTMVDAETGSEWDFSGRVVSGPLKDKQLTKVAVLNDYWFGWQTYHPKATVYQLE